MKALAFVAVIVSVPTFAADPPKFSRITCSVSSDPQTLVGLPLTTSLDPVGGFAEFDVAYGDFSAHVVKLGSLAHVAHKSASGLLIFDGSGSQLGWANLFPY